MGGNTESREVNRVAPGEVSIVDLVAERVEVVTLCQRVTGQATNKSNEESRTYRDKTASKVGRRRCFAGANLERSVAEATSPALGRMADRTPAFRHRLWLWKGCRRSGEEREWRKKDARWLIPKYR